MYIEKEPTFDAVQWDGTPEAKAEIELRYLETVSPEFHLETVVEDGKLIFKFQYGGSFEIPASGWLVSAPGWGTSPRQSRMGLGHALTDTEFQARYTQA